MGVVADDFAAANKHAGALLVAFCAPAASPGSGPNLFPVVVDGRYGYIDAVGNIIISPRFSYGWEFSDGLAPVELGSRSRGYAQGFIDAAERVSIPWKQARRVRALTAIPN